MADPRLPAYTPAVVRLLLRFCFPLLVGGLPVLAAPAASARVPAPSGARARVLLLGDSNMLGFFGRKLQARLRQEGFEVRRRAKHSSGLAFPGFWDWLERGPELAEEFDADVVVLFLGGNDAQSIKPRPYMGPWHKIPWDAERDWSDEYTRRLVGLAAAMTQGDRRLVVLSPTNRRSPKARQRMARILDLQRRALDGRRNIWWIDTFTLTSDHHGLYLAAGMDPRGRWVRYRRGDGIHLTEAGAERLLEAVVPELLGDALSL